MRRAAKGRQNQPAWTGFRSDCGKRSGTRMYTYPPVGRPAARVDTYKNWLLSGPTGPGGPADRSAGRPSRKRGHRPMDCWTKAADDAADGTSTVAAVDKEAPEYSPLLKIYLYIYIMIVFLVFLPVFGHTWAQERAQRPRLEQRYINQRKLIREIDSKTQWLSQFF